MTRRVSRSLLVSAGAAVGVLIASALGLALLGLYQSGHGGRAWTDTAAIEQTGVHLSIADVVTLAAGLCAAVGGFVLSYIATERADP
jgi:hypothetical protein